MPCHTKFEQFLLPVSSLAKQRGSGHRQHACTGWLPGGGGGTQIWFRRGCAAEAAKPVPTFKGHFGGKGYPLLRVLVKKIVFLCTLATKRAKISSIYSKITKVGVCLTLKMPEKLQLYGFYVYYVVHICDFGMLRVKVFQLKTIPYV